MRLRRLFWILQATTIAAVLGACGLNDHGDNPADVYLRTYQDAWGNVPPLGDQLGTTFYTEKGGGWWCEVHPDTDSPAYSETSERVTRVVVHELGNTLMEPGDLTPPGPGFPVGCYLLDSDATLDGLPPVCPDEAEYAREWYLDHGTKRVHVEDEWLRGHAERAVALWNEGAGVEVFRLVD